MSTPATDDSDERFDCPRTIIPVTLSEEQLYSTYEIQRTITEIRTHRYRRVALQFPDEMLADSPRIFNALTNGLKDLASDISSRDKNSLAMTDNDDFEPVEVASPSSKEFNTKLFILGDTSYGACCVDEIAAEHVDADVIVHYGRSCLSPPARIPVIHVFTTQLVPNQAALIHTFKKIYSDTEEKIILMADVRYQDNLGPITKHLRQRGYSNLHVAEIVHNPSSRLPNRTVPEEIMLHPSNLRDWHLFHISNPPESLLLTLSSRLKQMFIYLTAEKSSGAGLKPVLVSTHRALSRRYALLTSVTTVSTFGILINTLSVKNYLCVVDHVKTKIRAAGKTSYTFVVGKLNAAKVANFAEIGAWIVIGCWESSLIDSKDFWKPVLTPYELELALMADTERVWTGDWSSDFQQILDETYDETQSNAHIPVKSEDVLERRLEAIEGEDCDSEQESMPPDFDLRTGRYVSHTRPVQFGIGNDDNTKSSIAKTSSSLVRRSKREVATVGGDPSLAAEYLKSKRTWKGLGSDFDIAYEDTTIHEGTKGIARGYIHGHNGVRT